LEDVGVFCGHLVLFTAIWDILWLFGIFFRVLVTFTEKNLATLSRSLCSRFRRLNKNKRSTFLKDLNQSCQMVSLFRPKIPISVYIGGPWNGKCCYIFWSFGTFMGHLVIL
jgi:hypothetical protein